MATYSRYKSFVDGNGVLRTVPFIKIPKRDNDRYVYWHKASSRMDLLSYQYYGTPNYGWLILQANPTLPSMEYMIDEGERIRIPLPLEWVLTQYESDIKAYYKIESSND